MAEWQPIETAPRDGTEVLVFVMAPRQPIQEEPDRCLVAYFSGKYGEEYWDSWERGFSVKATHWQPLPEYPNG